MVREAVFSALDARGLIVGSRVLDLFAGSGALGIEALSRGAAHATFVEQDRNAAAVIQHNLGTLGFGDRSRVVRNDAGRALATAAAEPYDLVFADPPYTHDDEATAAVLDLIARSAALAPGAVVVLERPTGAVVTPPAGLEDTWSRTFGDTLVVFLGT
jgi:16S rRNA (guanine966-N2)-methyltransferase